MASINDGSHRRNKRRADDFVGVDRPSSDLVSARIGTDDPNPNANPNPNSSSSTASVVPLADQVIRAENDVASHPNSIQFFVRTISQGKTLILHGKPEDSLRSVHEKIQSVTGIPVTEQRLIYGGKQLRLDRSLAECMITNDAELHLVGRLRSGGHSRAWRLVEDLVSTVLSLCRGEKEVLWMSVKKMLVHFLSMTPPAESDIRGAQSHLNVFFSSCAPAALVLLYVSTVEGNKKCADQSIRRFLCAGRYMWDKSVYSQVAPIALEFCKLLDKAGLREDPLYDLCKSCLGSMVEGVDIGKNPMRYVGVCNKSTTVTIGDIFPFVSELGNKLSEGLVSAMESLENLRQSDVRDFAAFFRPLGRAIKDKVAFRGPIPMVTGFIPPFYREEIKYLHTLFPDLLGKVQVCLDKMEDLLEEEEREGDWGQYLVILKVLHDIAELFKGAEEHFWASLRGNKVSFCHLIVEYAKKGENHRWILEHKDMTDFESRRRLVMMLLPEVRNGFLYPIVIDRSQLLDESFEYVTHAHPEALRGQLFIRFRNEEAAGPGVLREWFFFVCQEIFSGINALFVACPNDRRRFFPNPASKANPVLLQYFRFAGRVIALALMHKIQVGIVFDRAFFLQLAGINVSLEDIRDADPYLYNSCKEILDMDPALVDQDALGLTFVREIEELGCMKAMELCPGGKNIIVNSENREKYVELLIQHCFVTPIKDQVALFARGFADIVGHAETQKLWFKGLELEDFDMILHGSESAISVEDWMAHTEYSGYKETDRQIHWFWKIVRGMTAEQRKTLLSFWTSIKYLPVEGFRGLDSKLQIHKTIESFDRLPASHTCFYQLYFPPYPSKRVMKRRINVIVKNHIDRGFGVL